MTPALWALLGFSAGAIAGSFLATLVIRWPQGIALTGRSRCDACGAGLRWVELAPLVSFAAQQGRCRRCGATIASPHVLVEAACATVGGVALFACPGPEGAAGALFGWILVTLAALDMRRFWLPDALTGLLAITGALGTLAGFAPGPIDRLIGGGAGFASLMTIGWSYRRLRGRDGIGMGDAKLLGAVGLWLGWRALPPVLLAASGMGLGLALAMRIAGREVRADTRLPLGALIAVAAFPAWLAMR